MESIDKNRARIAIGSFFVLHGLCFASWGIRIPTIQQQLSLSEAELGSVLFAVPVGSLVSAALASILIQKFSSKKVLVFSIAIHTLMLIVLGLAPSTITLVLCLMIFGFISNLGDVAVNTQAILSEALYEKSIMASFHGLWSLAGFAGAVIGSLMIAMGVIPYIHFIVVSLISSIIFLFNFRFLLPDRNSDEESHKAFILPDKGLMILGVIAFCSMICEGAMFDWSGVYFSKVIQVKPELTGVGYTVFMSTMAGTRFIADHIVTRFGLENVLIISGILISLGLFISVIQPSMISGIIGFLLIGIGTSSVVPMALGEAGKVKNRSTSSAVVAVSTIGFMGFLIGPPMIGWVAGATSLRVSFAILISMSLCICFLAKKVKYT